MTPKSLYLGATGNTERHRKLFKTEEVEFCLAQVFAEYCWHLPMSTDGATALQANSKRQGAKEFIDLLLTIADPVQSTPRVGTSGALERQGTDWGTHTPITPKPQS